MKNNKYVIWGLVIIALVYFCVMNIIVPYFSDDYGFMYSYDGSKITSFFQAVKQTGSFYMLWNGRLIPNFLGFTITSLLSDSVFNLLNTVIYLFVIICSIKLLWGGFDRTTVIGISALLIGLFFINKDDLFYWAIGSVNYLWPLLLFIILLLLIDKCHNCECILPSWTICLLGFLLSLTHEGYVMPLFGTLAIFLFFDYINHRLNKKLLFLELGIMLALIIVMLSPGVISRFNNTASTSGSLMVFLGKVFINVFMDLRIFYLMIIGLLVVRIKNKSKFKIFFKENLFLITLSLIGLVPAIMVSTGGRVLLCTEVTSLFVLARLVQQFLVVNNVTRMLTLTIDLAVLCLMCFIAFNSYHNWHSYKESEREYFTQADGTVIIDDSHNSAAYKIPGYIMNLDVVYDACVKSRLQSEKKYLKNVDTCEVIAPLPKSLLIILLDSAEVFFDEKNRVRGNAGFFTKENCNFFVARYNEQLEESINRGCLSFKNNIPFLQSKRFYVNISKEEILNQTMPMRIVELIGIGRVILFPKTYKSYSFATLEELNILDEPAASRFSIM